MPSIIYLLPCFKKLNVFIILETSFSLKSNDDDVAGDKEETDDDKRELKIASSQAQV